MPEFVVQEKESKETEAKDRSFQSGWNLKGTILDKTAEKQLKNLQSKQSTPKYASA